MGDYFVTDIDCKYLENVFQIYLLQYLQIVDITCFKLNISNLFTKVLRIRIQAYST